jgi:hypothetical protein
MLRRNETVPVQKSRFLDRPVCFPIHGTPVAIMEKRERALQRPLSLFSYPPSKARPLTQPKIMQPCNRRMATASL